MHSHQPLNGQNFSRDYILCVMQIHYFSSTITLQHVYASKRNC